jgi:tripartite-type tricarboxylate transporter receptor subunit TctC
LTGFLGQPVIVENVTGAAGTIGTGRVEPHPDGHVVCVGVLGTHLPGRSPEPAGKQGADH